MSDTDKDSHGGPLMFRRSLDCGLSTWKGCKPISACWNQESDAIVHTPKPSRTGNLSGAFFLAVRF